MAKPDPNIAAHLEWIGFVRPTGLVVSAPALDRAGAVLDRRDADGQRLLRERAEERRFASRDEPQPWLPDFRAFASSVLGWSFSRIGYARPGREAARRAQPPPQALQAPVRRRFQAVLGRLRAASGPVPHGRILSDRQERVDERIEGYVSALARRGATRGIRRAGRRRHRTAARGRRLVGVHRRTPDDAALQPRNQAGQEGQGPKAS